MLLLPETLAGGFKTYDNPDLDRFEASVNELVTSVRFGVR